MLAILLRAGPLVLRGIGTVGRAAWTFLKTPGGQIAAGGTGGFAYGVASEGGYNSFAGCVTTAIGFSPAKNFPIVLALGVGMSAGSFAGDMGLRKKYKEFLVSCGIADAPADIEETMEVVAQMKALNLTYDDFVNYDMVEPIFFKKTAQMVKSIRRNGGYGISFRVRGGIDGEGDLDILFPGTSSKFIDFLNDRCMGRNCMLTARDGKEVVRVLLVKNLDTSLTRYSHRD